jgi:aminoglycoside phosphotransferase
MPSTCDLADPALDLLTGGDAEDLLRAALATCSTELLSWRVDQVDHRPGGSTTVAYTAQVRADGREQRQVLGASTGLRAPADVPPGALVLSDGEQQVAVWRWPLDPGLPGLVAAADPEAVRTLLTSFGVPAGDVRLRVRTYRPRRRAVVQVDAPFCRLYLKVLRPQAVEALHARHRLLHDAGLPVPRSLGWTDDGLLVLQGLRGASLRERLQSTDGPLPDGAALLAVLDRLPPEVRALPRRRSWTDDVEHYAAVLSSALPGEAARCRQLADRIRAMTDQAPGDEPTHGDFYESQVLLVEDRISGLLDVDTAGPGRRADDLACLLAHTSVLAQMRPAQRPRLLRTGAEWLRTFDQRVDPAELRARVAGVALSLATGPHRVQDPDWPSATRARLDLVEQWVLSSERLADPVA